MVFWPAWCLFCCLFVLSGLDKNIRDRYCRTALINSLGGALSIGAGPETLHDEGKEKQTRKPLQACIKTTSEASLAGEFFPACNSKRVFPLF